MTFRQGNGFLLLVLTYQAIAVKVTEFLTLTIKVTETINLEGLCFWSFHFYVY